jgi:hypothetical protein
MTVLYQYTSINTYDNHIHYYNRKDNDNHQYYKLNDSSINHTISLYLSSKARDEILYKHTSVIIFKLPRSGSSWFTELLNK